MKKLIVVAFMSLFLFSGMAHATLYDRGGGLIYDDVLDITWLQDANYAKTNNDDTDGLMSWNDANAWVQGLDYGGYDDWRLPDAYIYEDTNGPEYGLNVITSELGYMFNINLEGDLSNNNIFEGIDTWFYWTDTPITVTWSSTPRAWAFSAGNFSQSYYTQNNIMAAWAVRGGDVGSAPVPEPTTMLLLGSGIVGLAGFRRKFKKS